MWGVSGAQNIGQEATADILVMRTLRKESSVTPSIATHQVLLFANPVVPDLLAVRVDDEATST
jgi:hypothetical protein